MAQKDDIQVLEMLSEYKWAHGYKCDKCGHTEFSVRKEKLSRICKNKDCRYEETVFKFTAFEGISFDIRKALAILEYLYDNCVINRDKRGILLEPERKNEQALEETYNLGESVSLNELIAIYEDGQIGKKKFEELITKYVSSEIPTVAGLALRFEIEENTVAKLISKISRWTNNDHRETSLNELLEYFQLCQARGGSYFYLRIFMTPFH